MPGLIGLAEQGGRAAFKLGVDVVSAMDEALTGMPDTPLTTDELQNTLKARGVQQKEIDNSEVLRFTSNNPDGKLKPKDIQHVTNVQRKDLYTTQSIGGRAIDMTPPGESISFDTKARWENLAGDDRPFNTDEIVNLIDQREKAIIRIRENTQWFVPEEIAEMVAGYEEQLVELLSLKDEAISSAPAVTTGMVNQFKFLISNSDIPDDFTIENVEEAIRGFKAQREYMVDEAIAAPNDMNGNELAHFESEVANVDADIAELEKMKEALGQAEVNANAPTWPEMLEREGFAENMPLSPANLPNIVEEVHRISGPQAARVFEQEAHELIRQQGNKVYDFPNDAYRDYALPDTDDASYAVTLYDNKAVDKKGYNYSDYHFANDVDARNSVFHTRTDSPEPGVHRIQEIQSDIQNAMTKQKQGEIEAWRGNASSSISGSQILQNNGALSSRSEQIQHEVFTELGEEFTEAVGVNFAEHAGLDVTKGIHRYMQGVARILRNPTSPRYDEEYSEPTELFLRTLSNEFQTDIPKFAKDDPIVQEIAERTDMSYQQINTAIEMRNEAYEEGTNKINSMVAAAKTTDNLRVTPEKRRMRITDSPNSHLAPEEAKLQTNALTSVKDTMLAKHNYIIEQPKHIEDVNDKVLEAVFDLDMKLITKLLTTHPDIKSPGHLPGNRPIDDQLALAAKILERYDTTAHGLMKDVLGDDLPDIPKMIAEGKEAYHSTIDKGMKDLTPLEKFPHNDKYQLDIPFVKQGLQEEIVKAIKKGDKEVWLTGEPEGVSNLARGDGPHAAYQEGGKTYSLFKKMANRFGATLKEENGYLKMILPTKVGGLVKAGVAGGGLLTVNAYAEPDTQDFRTVAFDEGYRPGEVDSYLAETPIEEQELASWEEQALNQGYTQEELTQYKFEEWVKELTGESFAEPEQGDLIESDVPTVSGDPVFSKLSDDDVKQLAIDLKVNPLSSDGISAIYKESLRRSAPAEYKAAYENSDLEQVRQTIADMEEMVDYDRPWLAFRSWRGNPEAEARYDEIKAKEVNKVIEMGAEQGLELVRGQGAEIDGLEADEWYVVTDQGLQAATPGFLDQMARVSGEIAGGIAGAGKGLRVASKAGATIDPFIQGMPLAKGISLLTKFGIVTAYTAAGALLGDQADLVSAAIRQNRKIDEAVVTEKMIGSTQMAVVGEVVGVPAMALGGIGLKWVRHAYRELTDGNLKASYEFLKTQTGLTDDQATEIVEQWKRLHNKTGPLQIETSKGVGPLKYQSTKTLNPMEEAIAILPGSTAGGDNIIEAVGKIDMQASIVTARQVNERASDMIAEAKKRVALATGDDDLVIAVQKGLSDHINDVKTFYNVTKSSGNDLVVDAYKGTGKGYKFDIDKLAIQPLKDVAEGWLENHSKIQNAAVILTKIDKLTTSRTFDDLIELRQTINNFSNIGKPNHVSVVAFREALATIDDEIAKTMAETPGGDEWMKQWGEARKSYGEMSDLKQNVLVKALIKEKKGGKIVPKPGINPQTAANAFVKFGIASDGTYREVMNVLDHKTWRQIETNIVDTLTNKWTFGAEGELKAIQFPELDNELRTYDFLTREGTEMQQAAARLAEVYANDVNISYISGGIKLTQPSQGLSANIQEKAKYSTVAKVWTYMSRFFGTKNANAAALVHKVADFLENPLDAATVERAIEAAQGDAGILKSIEEMQKAAAGAMHAGEGTLKIQTYKNSRGDIYTTPVNGAQPADAIPRHRIAPANMVVDKLRMNPESLSNIEKRMLKNSGYKAVMLEDGQLIVLD